MQIYKIINGIDRIDSKIFFELSSGLAAPGHSQKLVKQHARFGIRLSVFSQRVVDDWNLLPAEIIESRAIQFGTIVMI